MSELNSYEKLNPLERGELFKRIKEDQNLSYKELADKIGKSASFAANSVRLTELPIAIKDGLLGGVISEGHARALASLENTRDCISIYKNVLKNHANVRETEELVREAKKEKKIGSEISPKQAKKIKERLEKILDIKITKIESETNSKKLTLKLYLSS